MRINILQYNANYNNKISLKEFILASQEYKLHEKLIIKALAFLCSI